jgi:DNA-binding transcriptional ArsR family regulator
MVYTISVPPLPTTSDPFSALAEPRRREIVEILAKKERLSVNELVDLLGLRQPAVSKHLGVLRKVGLVTVHKDGQQRFYSFNPERLRPVQEWIATFERFWTDHLGDIKKVAERKALALKNPRNSN